MARRTQTGREILKDGIDDVSGAYYINRKTLTAIQLQEVVEVVAARALLVPSSLLQSF